MTREDVLKEFTVTIYYHDDVWEEDLDTNSMADEIVKLREENTLLKKNLELTIDPYSHGEW